MVFVYFWRCIYIYIRIYIYIWWHVVKVVLCFISHCLARGVLMFCLSSLHLEWIWRASLVRLMDSMLLLSAVEKDIMTIAISTTTSTATSSSSSSSSSSTTTTTTSTATSSTTTTTTKAATLTSSTTKAAASQWCHQHLQLDVYCSSARTHIQDMYLIVYIYIHIYIYP